MKRIPIPFFVVFFALCVVTFISILIRFAPLVTLFPVGLVAQQERGLILTVFFLAFLIVIPVLVAMFYVAWHFREGNEKAKRQVETSSATGLKLLWWVLPTSLILVLAIITWKAAHALDPFQPISSSTPTMTIQVVALRWKWLFIYPKEHIATVNFVELPVHTPVDFALTAADAPMNSFWVPSLGGQMYAMEAMENHLHLLSDSTGDFPGGAAEINGSGFSGMRFTVRVAKPNDFTAWVQHIQRSKNPLTSAAYNQLALPSEYNPVAYYSSIEQNLYTTIIMKYMQPSSVGANLHRDGY